MLTTDSASGAQVPGPSVAALRNQGQPIERNQRQENGNVLTMLAHGGPFSRLLVGRLQPVPIQAAAVLEWLHTPVRGPACVEYLQGPLAHSAAAATGSRSRSIRTVASSSLGAMRKRLMGAQILGDGAKIGV